MKEVGEALKTLVRVARELTLGDVTSISWDPSSSRFAATGTSGLIALMDRSGLQKLVGKVGHGPTYSVSWSPRGDLVAVSTGWEGRVEAVTLDGEVAWSKASLGGNASSLDWNNDGSRLVVALSWGSSTQTHGRVVILDSDGETIWESGDLGERGRIAKWSPDGELIAVGTLKGLSRGSLIVFDRRGRVKAWTTLKGQAMDIEWSPDSSTIYVAQAWEDREGVRGGRITLHKPTGEQISPTRETSGWSLSLSFNRQKGILAVGMDEGLRLYTPDLRYHIPAGSTGIVHSLSWSPDGEYLAVGEGVEVAVYKASGTTEVKFKSGIMKSERVTFPLIEKAWGWSGLRACGEYDIIWPTIRGSTPISTLNRAVRQWSEGVCRDIALTLLGREPKEDYWGILELVKKALWINAISKLGELAEGWNPKEPLELQALSRLLTFGLWDDMRALESKVSDLGAAPELYYAWLATEISALNGLGLTAVSGALQQVLASLERKIYTIIDKGYQKIARSILSRLSTEHAHLLAKVFQDIADSIPQPIVQWGEKGICNEKPYPVDVIVDGDKLTLQPGSCTHAREEVTMLDPLRGQRPLTNPHTIDKTEHRSWWDDLRPIEYRGPAFRPPQGIPSLGEACVPLGCGSWSCSYRCGTTVARVPRHISEHFEEGDLVSASPIVMSKLIEEVERYRAVESSHLMAIIDLHYSTPIIVYKFAPHGSLAYQLETGWAPGWRVIAEVALHVARALKALHSHSLVHGDVRPSNILLLDRRAVLADPAPIVELALLASRGQMQPLPGWRAPEQVYSDLRRETIRKAVEDRADMYMLGNTILYALTGDLVDGEEAVSRSLVAEATSRIEEPRLVALVEALLRPKPWERPSASQAILALERLLTPGETVE
ncbi:MAG: protein kinase [Desulfurococcales archaeon]|nr:protein kinase [Desulfurococcales archaeon]